MRGSFRRRHGKSLSARTATACAIAISPCLRSSSSARNATATSTRESPATSWSKSKRARRRSSDAPALEELRDRREAQRHVRGRRLRAARPPAARSAAASCSGILRRELALRLRARAAPGRGGRSGRGARSSRSRSQRGRLLRAPVLGEPPRELLGRLLGLELGELGVLVGEEPRAPSARAAPRSGRGTRRTRRGRARRARSRCSTNATTISARSTSRSWQLLAQDERQQEVERPLERVEVQLELAHGHRHARQASRATGRGPSGWPSRGPCGIGSRLRLPASPGAAPARRRAENCHQTKNAVEPTKTTIETQAFSRRPAMWCDGSIAQQLLEEAAEAVVGDVEREQRRRPDPEAPADPDQQQRRRRGPRSARRGTSGGRSRRSRYCERPVRGVDLRGPTAASSACRRAPGSTSCRSGRCPARAAAGRGRVHEQRDARRPARRTTIAPASVPSRIPPQTPRPPCQTSKTPSTSASAPRSTR